MSARRRLSVLMIFLPLLFVTASFTLNKGLADIKFRSQNVEVTVKGTSTLHDWEEKSQKGTCEALFALDNDRVTGLSSLVFSLPVESIKSEHTLMDNNTYKALKSGSFKNITFVLSSATVTQQNATTSVVKAIGKLTIAGATKETDIAGTVTYNAADKSYTIAGAKKIRMTDYGVTPPSVMLGTIKTGNDITVYFNAKIVR